METVHAKCSTLLWKELDNPIAHVQNACKQISRPLTNSNKKNRI